MSCVLLVIIYWRLTSIESTAKTVLQHVIVVHNAFAPLLLSALANRLSLSIFIHFQCCFAFRSYLEQGFRLVVYSLYFQLNVV